MDDEQAMVNPNEHPATPSNYEIDFVASRLAESFVRMTDYYRERERLTGEEAEQRAGTPTEWSIERLTTAPADRLSWWDLQFAERQDPALAVRVWEGIKAAAREEFDSGHRAASVFDFYEEPWTRAQYLAIRASFREQWQPQGGVEDALIDGMAQMHAGYLYWLGQLHLYATTEGKMAEHDIKKSGHWEPPRVQVAERIEQAATMVERFNRLFLRTLRALRDLRRYAPTVVVQHAGQVNVAAVQSNSAYPVSAPERNC
jgi:hypothetical protein